MPRAEVAFVLLLLLTGTAAALPDPDDLPDVPPVSVLCVEASERTVHWWEEPPPYPPPPPPTPDRWKRVEAHAEPWGCGDPACGILGGSCCATLGPVCDLIRDVMELLGHHQVGTAFPVVGGGACVTYSFDQILGTTAETRDCVSPS